MKKINWKREIRHCFCILLSIALIWVTQTEKQLQSIMDFFWQKDWMMVLIIISSVIGLSKAIEKAFKLLPKIMQLVKEMRNNNF